MNQTIILNIRLAKKEDQKEIIKIYHEGSAFLHTQGINQWQNNYPNDHSFEEDLSKKQVYVLLFNQIIVGVFSLIKGIEPTYNYIENGHWLCNNSYITIHRFTISSTYRNKGFASYVIDYVENLARTNAINSIRIDTHKDNLPMQGLLKKKNFTYCGIIYLQNKDSRLAFEKEITKK